MFVFGVSQKEGWFFSPNLNVYQKVNDRVYCYISKAFGFYILQLYKRGTATICTLEARCENIEKLFNLGEEWLKKYKKYPEEELAKDRFHIDQPNWREMRWVV